MKTTSKIALIEVSRERDGNTHKHTHQMKHAKLEEPEESKRNFLLCLITAEFTQSLFTSMLFCCAFVFLPHLKWRKKNEAKKQQQAETKSNKFVDVWPMKKRFSDWLLLRSNDPFRSYRISSWSENWVIFFLISDLNVFF